MTFCAPGVIWGLILGYLLAGCIPSSCLAGPGRADGEATVVIASGSSNDYITQEHVLNLFRREKLEGHVQLVPFLTIRVQYRDSERAKAALISEVRRGGLLVAVIGQASIDQAPPIPWKTDARRAALGREPSKDVLVRSAIAFTRNHNLTDSWTHLMKLETRSRQYLNRSGEYERAVDVRLHYGSVSRGRVIQGPAICLQVWGRGRDVRYFNRLRGDGFVALCDPRDVLTRMRLNDVLGRSGIQVRWDSGELYASSVKRAPRIIRQDAAHSNYLIYVGRRLDERFAPDKQTLLKLTRHEPESGLPRWAGRVISALRIRGFEIPYPLVMAFQRRKYLGGVDQGASYHFWIPWSGQDGVERILEGQTWKEEVRLWPVGQNSLLTDAWGGAAAVQKIVRRSRG